MPSFPPQDKQPPNTVEIYNPDDIVMLFLGDKTLQVVKGSYREQVVQIPIPGDPRGTTRPSEIFECLAFKPGTNEFHQSYHRVIGKADAIVAMVLDDQK